MNTLRAFSTLAPIDLKNIRRDSMLVWLPAIPLIPALLVRWGLPLLEPWLVATYGLTLEPYDALILSFFVALTPSFAGIVTGFLLLDERDDRTLTALMVTPMSLSQYVAYRVTAPMVLGVVMTLVAIPIAGVARVPLPALLGVALLAALTAPIMALFLASFAENKVAGMALMKLIGGLGVIPVAAYFVEVPWQLLAGVVPSYWPLKVLWLASENGQNVWLFFAAGLLVNLAVLAALVKRFGSVRRQ